MSLLFLTFASLAARPLVEAPVLQELAASPDGRAYVLVVLEEPPAWSGAGRSGRQLLVRSTQRAVLESFANGEFEIAYRYRNFPAFTGRVRSSGLEKLATHPLVVSVGPDAMGELRLDSSRPYLGADRVELELEITGKGATVVVADTGIDTDHPDLSDSIARGAFHFLNQGADIGPGAEDDTSFGHGVAVSGLITSNGTVAPRGIAPDADILAIKVTPNQGELMASDVNAAADYAASMKDRYEHLVAMNYSLGFYFSGIALPEPCPCDAVNTASLLSQMAVQAAKDAGILTFGASGNTGSCGLNGQMGYPECVTACVAVGAAHDVDYGRVPSAGTYLSWCVAEEGSEACQGAPSCFDEASAPDTPICFMDRTECTQLVAPGWDIITTRIGGGMTDGLAGTSFASPHAAAVAALLAGRCLTPDQVLAIMKSTGRTISDGCPTGTHEVTIIDAFAAVSAAESLYPLCTDCNRNSVPDSSDISSGTSQDCDSNGIPDECEPGCNQNGVPDSCEIAAGASADCNGNGIPDECDVLPQGFSLSPPAAVSTGAIVIDLTAGDLDGDSNADLIASSSSPKGLSVLFGRGDGSSLDPVLIPTAGAPSSTVAADWDRDGLLDLATVVPGTAFRPGNSVLVVTTGFGRTFSEPRALTVGTLPRDLVAADLDSDGDIDLATVNENSGDVSVLVNGGNGGFAEAVSTAVMASPAFLAAADWDGDGDTDLLAASRKSMDVSALTNDGAGIFATAPASGLGFLPVFFHVADLNGDGRVDVISGDAESGDVSVFLRNAEGTLANTTSYEVWPGPVPIAPADVLAADLNGDGAVDVVTANSRIDSVSVLLNKGDGTLREAVQFDAGDGPKALAAAKLKSRAGLDLIAAGSGASAAKLQLLFNASEPPTSIDANRNGKPDECETQFHRGDPNGDGQSDISDGIAVLNFLFAGGSDPACRESADAQNDGAIDISDGVYLLNWLFLGGLAPEAPGPSLAPCGVDPDLPGSPGSLGCTVYPSCE